MRNKIIMRELTLKTKIASPRDPMNKQMTTMLDMIGLLSEIHDASNY